MVSRTPFDSRVDIAFQDNTQKLITPMKAREGIDAVLDFADDAQRELIAEDTRIEGKVDGVIVEIGNEDSPADNSLRGKLITADDDIKELKRINEEVTDPALALLPDLRTDVNAAQHLADTNKQGLIDTNLRIDGLPTGGGGTSYDDTAIRQRITDGLMAEMNARVDADNLLRAQTNKIPQLRIDVDAANTQATTNKDDILTEKGRIDELINNPVSGVSEQKVEELIEENRTTGADFVIRSGVTPAFAPGVFYRGTGDQDYFNAQQANIPGLIFQRASGSFVIPAVTLTDIPAGTRFRWSGAYLNPGKTGRQSGFDPLFYYVIEQGVNRLVGAGAVGSSDDLVRNWAVTQGIDNSTELVTDLPVTGTDIIVRWIAIYGGEDAILRPSLSAGNVNFVGELEPFVEHIVHDVTDARFNTLEGDDQRLLAGLEGANTNIESNRTRIDSADGLIQGLRDKFNEPQFQAIEEATIVGENLQTLDATELNKNLGINDNPFAGNSGDPIGDGTQMITRFTRADQFLRHGSGQIARVIDGRLVGYELVPHQDARTEDSDTMYITTRDGYGTRARPAVLEFGITPPGSNVPSARDTEVFLDTGIPAVGATITNISLAFALRTNNNWNTIANTIQLAIRSGEVRSFAIPGVEEMTFTATALADGRIQGRATHNRGTGNSNQLVTNGAAIRFDAGYIETVSYPAVQRGQQQIDLGAFTGENIFALDLIQTGDSASPDGATIEAVTPTIRYKVGYFLSDTHRTGFRTDNPGFDIFVSDADTALTPEILAQLDGADPFLGLFARNNHHADSLELLKTLRVPTTDGTKVYNVGDQLELLTQAGGGSGSGLSAQDVQGIVDTAISQSLDDKGAISNALPIGIKLARLRLTGDQITNGIHNVIDDDTGIVASASEWFGRILSRAAIRVTAPATTSKIINGALLGWVNTASTANLNINTSGTQFFYGSSGNARNNSTGEIGGFTLTFNTDSIDLTGCVIDLVVAYIGVTEDELFAGLPEV